jgi:hypothetical protein
MSDQSDDWANNQVAAGAVWAALGTGLTQTIKSAEIVPGGAGNQIDVEFEFLESSYRLTVERVTS